MSDAPATGEMPAVQPSMSAPQINPIVPPVAPATSTTPTTPAAQSTAPGQEPEGEDGDVFDRDRAMATIRKLRDEAKRATAQIKELDQLRAEKLQREQAAMTEQERREARIKQLEAEVEFERHERRDRTNQYEVQLRAGKLGIVDPDAAVKLLDWGALAYDDEGRPRDVDAALKDLIKERPYLVGTAPTSSAQGPSATSPTNGATRAPQPGQRLYSRADLNDYAFYAAHREDIQLAYREGRIRD